MTNGEPTPWLVSLGLQTKSLVGLQGATYSKCVHEYSVRVFKIR